MSVLKYSLLRLGAFFIVFAACLMLDLGRYTVIFALIVGLIVSWALGYLFFNRLRLEAGQELARRFGGDRKLGSSELDDNQAEDALAEDFHLTQEKLRAQQRSAEEQGPQTESPR
ncbi:DUF4229 domain-containing protein [Nesterenkonia sp. LB17]|uniref:DUF4229 domain-containing protein n=1 Tax=unclassified Nesterenkonia TaxID=2629769 RepID=UPI001F4C7159|nr:MULTISPECIES: DUF4229 domain-containing protein [unclassified Nesterenkonia]MCH8560637.1 DUF4229 domain-containing protein [Nesterenkonia sp. DZ6]MCH8562915.1 DUF4229 domain-containing protein [Nesterenkonia sp. YGD6]MCH8565953.1 DUF4229 domain-containing protein [Nesterenkonia sp. LB17]MCH8570745.1 DUF4229 domain-containing protein [Nesterenkonia sp. AY15]